MLVSLGFVKSPSQILIKDLDWEMTRVSTRIIDSNDLIDHSLQALLIGDSEHFSQLSSLLEKEKTHYPIWDASDLKTEFNEFEQMPAFQFKELYQRQLNRSLMIHNCHSVENLTAMAAHLKTLWIKDRLSFFEELWYWMKRNLATTDLTFIFNDIKQAENDDKEKDEEKKNRPKLVQSLLSGTKKANFLAGSGKEQELMATYMEKYAEGLEITEWDAIKGRFVATVQIDRSPIIMMGHLTQLNQFQRSLLKGLFNGIL